jgi:hypothetical protein
MSSLLIEIGIQPIIVIVPNHAFVGWRIWEDEDEYNFVQTTMMGDENKTFKDAYEDAEKMAHSNGLSDLVYGDLDVYAFGKRGIYNKSNSVKVLNINLLREYKDSKGRKIYTATPVTLQAEEAEKKRQEEEMSASSVLVGYDWVYPDMNNKMAAWRFSGRGTFSVSQIFFGGSTRRGTWKDLGNGQVELIYDDGGYVVSGDGGSANVSARDTITILSKSNFKKGSTIYRRY